MSERGVSERLARHLAETMSDSEWAAVFAPDGLARHTLWDCEDHWIIGYTTESIRNSRGGVNDGKFAVFAYKPVGKGARTDPQAWEMVYYRITAKMKTARKRADQLFYKHSPETAKRHGVLDE